jgi:hypothetical protein
MSNVLYNEVGSAGVTPKNIGGSTQVFEAPTKKIALGLESFSFTTAAAFKLEANWNAGIVSKSLAFLPVLEDAPEAANIEPAYKEGRYSKKKLKDGEESINYKVQCSIKTYEALKSYEDSAFTRVFQISEEGEVSVDALSDGTIKGRKVSSLTIGLRFGSTDEDTGYCMVNVVYENDIFSILKTSFDVLEKESIYPVQFVQTSATSTEIKGKIIDLGTNLSIKSLQSGDILVKDLSGATHTSTFTAADSNGDYTLTGTGFQSDMTIVTNGVVSQAGVNYESEIATKIVVS